MPQPLIERKHIYHIDSADAISHVNNNPAKYTYDLMCTIPRVIRIRMLNYLMPYTPTFIVVRVSDWETSSANFDDVHDEAVWLEAQLKNVTVGKSTVVASIFNEAETVSLAVVECFTLVHEETPTHIKTYDIFVCTGKVETTIRTGWSLSIPDRSTVIELTADAGSTLSLNTVRDSIHLHLGSNNTGVGSGRLRSNAHVMPKWESFQVYRRGQTVQRGGSYYECVENHMSLIFTDDLDTNRYWNSMTGVTVQDVINKTAATHAFYVFQSANTNQTTLVQDTSHADITYHFPPRDISQIDLEFRNINGMQYIFPYEAAIDFKSFIGTGTDVATVSKKYLSHTVTLEITYLDEADL